MALHIVGRYPFSTKTKKVAPPTLRKYGFRWQLSVLRHGQIAVRYVAYASIKVAGTWYTLLFILGVQSRKSVSRWHFEPLCEFGVVPMLRPELSTAFATEPEVHRTLSDLVVVL